MPQAQAQEMSLELNEIIESGIEKVKGILPDGYNIEYEFIVTDDQIHIHLYIVTKMLEISEYCSDVEDENQFNECYESILNEINEEYALRTMLHLETDKYEIRTFTLECDDDYCYVGGEIEITIKSIDVADIQRLMYYLEHIITLFIKL